MPNNSALRSADRNKNDEFYIKLADIELEPKNYKKYFKDKIDEMEGHQITPWHLGKKTDETNLQILYKDCNRKEVDINGF